MQEHTQQMIQQYVDSPETDEVGCHPRTAHDIAATLTQVAQLVHSIKGRLELMQQHGSSGLDGLFIPAGSQAPQVQSSVLLQRPSIPHVAGGASSHTAEGSAVAGAGDRSALGILSEPTERVHDAGKAVGMLNRVVRARFLAKRWSGACGQRVNPEQPPEEVINI